MENQFISALKLGNLKSALSLISELIFPGWGGQIRSIHVLISEFCNCQIHVRNQLLLAEYKCLLDDWPSCSAFKT